MESADAAEDEATGLSEAKLHVSMRDGRYEVLRVTLHDEYAYGDLVGEIQDGFTQNSFFQFPLADGTEAFLNVPLVADIRVEVL